jgi:hypothetical protein
MSLEKSRSPLLFVLCLSLSHFSLSRPVFIQESKSSFVMTCWLSVSGTDWLPSCANAREIHEYRTAHLGLYLGLPHVSASPREICLQPCDGGPPLRIVDLKQFRAWADQRRVSPAPGVVLALALFNHPPDLSPYEENAPVFWRRAVEGLQSGLAQLSLLTDDTPMGRAISVANTEDFVWFLARCTYLLTWMDSDRGLHEDATEVLPVMPLCLELVHMATRCIALGKGLPRQVARSAINLLMFAAKEAKARTGADWRYVDINEHAWDGSPLS